MTLPETVVQHLEAATVSEAEDKQDEPKNFIASLGAMLRRLIDMAASSAEVVNEDKSEKQQVGESYGYPVTPAYGVPHNVAVQLLQRTFALLSKIVEVNEIDDTLNAELSALLKDISAALGLQAKTDTDAPKRIGTWQWIQKAFDTEIPTEPLVTPSQAADALEQAVSEFEALSRKSDRTGEQIQKTVLDLRTAIRQAVRVLRTIAQDSVVPVVETEANQPAEMPNAEATSQEPDTSSSTVEQVAAVSVDEQIETQRNDDYIERLDAIEKRIEELHKVVEQLINIPIIKQRATMFAASNEGKPKTLDDAARSIRERYFSTRNDLEKRVLMKEAERLIAESFLNL